jgi:hypothetical protein
MPIGCITVANTGFPIDRIILVATSCLIGGAVLLLLGRARRRGRSAGVLALALVVVAVAASVIAGASAATAGQCAPDTNSQSALTIVQTSSNIGLSPTVPPAGITGRLTNNSDKDVFVGSVTVSIVAIAKAAHASSGPCTAGDYTLTSPLMRVGQTLHGGQSVDFAGAAIGFRGSAANQDACQRAIVRLRFTSSGQP